MSTFSMQQLGHKLAEERSGTLWVVMSQCNAYMYATCMLTLRCTPPFIEAALASAA